MKQQLVHYAELASKSVDGYDRYDEKFRLIGREIAELNSKKQKLLAADRMQDEYQKQIAGVEKFFDDKKNADKFDDILVRKMVRAIRVESVERLEMQMCSGEVVELQM